MLETLLHPLANLLRPLATRWASTYPDPSPVVANAVSASPSQPLWVGPMLDARTLENGLLSVLIWGLIVFLLIVAFNAFGLYARRRAKMGNPITVHGFLPVMLGMSLAAFLCLGLAASYAQVDGASGRAAVVTGDGILSYSADETEKPAVERVALVTICKDCPYVDFRLTNGRMVTIYAHDERLEALRSAAATVATR